MDFSELDNDELADAGAAWFAEVERRIAASSHPFAEEAAYLTDKAHKKMNRVRRKLVEGDVISTFSGGDPKPE